MILSALLYFNNCVYCKASILRSSASWHRQVSCSLCAIWSAIEGQLWEPSLRIWHARGYCFVSCHGEKILTDADWKLESLSVAADVHDCSSSPVRTASKYIELQFVVVLEAWWRRRCVRLMSESVFRTERLVGLIKAIWFWIWQVLCHIWETSCST